MLISSANHDFWHMATFLIIAPYKYSYLLTAQFPVDNCLWQFCGITYKKFLLQGLQCYNSTQMKALDKYDKYVKYCRDLEMWVRWSFKVTGSVADQ